MANILILIGGHLCTAPRPQKEAEALAEAGYDVIVQGVWFDPELVKRDRLLLQSKKWQFSPILDFQPQHRFQNLKTRLQGRIAKERYQHFKIFSPDLLGYGARAMLRVARQIRADLTIVHSEAGLWVANQLLEEGFRVGVDFEDWFSEDLLPEARVTRPIAQLKALEQRLMRECQYCLTTSQAMAEAMARAYQAPKPTVIYNSFPWAEREQIDHQKRDRKNPQIPSIHWFSQTIGPGRGLELLFQALPDLKSQAEIHLRGHYPDSSRQWLEPLIPSEWHDRVFIHPTVPNQELLSRIAEHDIGLALETPYCFNKQYTSSNKLFQYIQAGLAVIATDTAGQREIFAQFSGIGHLIPCEEPVALAFAMNSLLSSSAPLVVAKSAALNAFRERLHWENQNQILLSQVEHATN
jgi:glycosyltransferase involved in cell wall biosynthesis